MNVKGKCPECGAGLWRGPISFKRNIVYGEYCMTSVWVKGSCSYLRKLKQPTILMSGEWTEKKRKVK